MDDDARQQALLTALTTEHFVLQTARSTTVSEANGRSSLYLTSVSSALVALGIADMRLSGTSSASVATTASCTRTPPPSSTTPTPT